MQEARDQEIIASASKKRSSSSSSKSTSQNKAYKTVLSPAKQMTHVQTTKANNLASRSKNFVEDMVNKKNAKSLHMSIHFSSHSGGESSKTTSPIIQKIKSLKNFTASLSVSKNNSASSQTKTKVSTFFSNICLINANFFLRLCGLTQIYLRTLGICK